MRKRGLNIMGHFGRQTRLPLRLVFLGIAQGVLAALVALGGHRLMAEGANSAGLLAGVTAAVCLSALLIRFERIEAERVAQAAAQEIRAAITRHILRLPFTGETLSAGAVSMRYGGDLTAVTGWIGRGRAETLVGVPTIAAGFGALLFLAPVAAAALAGLGVLLIGGQIAGAARLRQTAGALRRLRTRLIARAMERFDARAAVQMFDRVEAEAVRIDRRGRKVAHAAEQRAKAEGDLRACSAVAAGLFPVLALVVLSQDVASAGATLMVAGLISPRLRALGRAWERYHLAAVAMQNIDLLLQKQVVEERRDARGIARLEGRLALRNLRLTADSSLIDVEIPAGSRVAVVGPNGVGKSRLLKVIAGLEYPLSGSIVIDGRNTGKRRLSALRQHVCLAGADVPLISASFDESLRYGARLKHEDADRVQSLAGADSIRLALPDGGRTRIGPRGEVLSAGQRAKASLIRALLRDPNILLLDEIEAPLDQGALAEVETALRAFPGTLLRATHDPVVVAASDFVLQLESDHAALVANPNSTEFRSNTTCG